MMRQVKQLSLAAKEHHVILLKMEIKLGSCHSLKQSQPNIFKRVQIIEARLFPKFGQIHARVAKKTRLFYAGLSKNFSPPECCPFCCSSLCQESNVFFFFEKILITKQSSLTAEQSAPDQCPICSDPFVDLGTLEEQRVWLRPADISSPLNNHCYHYRCISTAIKTMKAPYCPCCPSAPLPKEEHAADDSLAHFCSSSYNPSNEFFQLDQSNSQNNILYFKNTTDFWANIVLFHPSISGIEKSIRIVEKSLFFDFPVGSKQHLRRPAIFLTRQGYSEKKLKFFEINFIEEVQRKSSDGKRNFNLCLPMLEYFYVDDASTLFQTSDFILVKSEGAEIRLVNMIYLLDDEPLESMGLRRLVLYTGHEGDYFHKICSFSKKKISKINGRNFSFLSSFVPEE